MMFFFFSSRRRHTRCGREWSSDVCSSDLRAAAESQGPFEPDSTALGEVMRDELLGLLLRDALIAQPEFEVPLTRLRSALLLGRALRARAPLDFLCSLALQCFNNEFIFAETQPESAQVVEVQREVEANLRNHAFAGEL